MERQEGWPPCYLQRKINRHPIKLQCPASPSPPGAGSPSLPSASLHPPVLSSDSDMQSHLLVLRKGKPLKYSEKKAYTWLSAVWFGRRKIETVIKSGDPTFAASSGFGGELKGGGFFLLCFSTSFPLLCLLLGGVSYPAPRRGRGEEARGGPAAPYQRCLRLGHRARRAPRPHLWLLSGLRGLSWPCHPRVSSM